MKDLLEANGGLRNVCLLLSSCIHIIIDVCLFLCIKLM